MPFIRVNQTGQIGTNKDLSVHELPLNAWTDSKNMRYLDGSAISFLGYKAVFGTPSVIPYHVLPVKIAGVSHWLYAGAAKIYDVTGTTHTNITRQTASVDVDYTGGYNRWTSTVLGGIPILNNGVDAPQQWILTGKCTALTNWPASTTCAVMRSYKNYLIALDVTKTATRYPYMVKWSSPADPGSVPATWDITDATNDAGELDLSDGYDYIVDGLALRDSFVIYKQTSVWRMDYTGGVFVFKVQKVLGTSGALNRNCIAEIDGQHFVLTADDVVIHDGQVATSVLDAQTRRDLFSSISQTVSDLCFVFKNPFYGEMYVCYPQAGSIYCDKAVVWNWKTKTVAFRDMPNVLHAGVGLVDQSTGDTFTTVTGTFDSQTTAFDNQASALNPSRVLLAAQGQKLYLLDETAQLDGSTQSAYLERVGLSFDTDDAIKLVRGVRPRISGSNGSTVLVSIGTAASPYESPTYGAAMTYTIGTTIACDCLASGRYIAIKYASGTASQWRLDSYEIDIQPQGKW